MPTLPTIPSIPGLPTSIQGAIAAGRHWYSSLGTTAAWTIAAIVLVVGLWMIFRILAGGIIRVVSIAIFLGALFFFWHDIQGVTAWMVSK